MSPLAHLNHDTVETSTMTDRQLLVGCYDALREINGTVKSHGLQLRFLWRALAAIFTATLTVLGFLLQHVL